MAHAMLPYLLVGLSAAGLITMVVIRRYKTQRATDARRKDAAQEAQDDREAPE